MRSIKFKDYINIVRPEYVYLKLTPNNSIRNQSSYKIARSISSIYKSIFQRIQIEEKKMLKVFKREFFVGTKYTINAAEKIGYFIYIEKKKVEFYFIIPKQHQGLLEEKMTDAWHRVTIEKVDEIPIFSDNTEMRQMVYEKEDALSLRVDRRGNDLLSSTLNIVNVLCENDKVGLFYNFIPTTQRGWRAKYKETVDKFNMNMPVDRDKWSSIYLLKWTLKMLVKLIDEVFKALTDKKDLEQNNVMEQLIKRMTGRKELKEETLDKESDIIIKTQVIAFSDSDNKINRQNNLKSITQSFESITGDNRLVAKRIKGKQRTGMEIFNDIIIKTHIDGVDVNYFSDKECNNIISLPGESLLDEFNDQIAKVETNETMVPEDLREGKWRLGISTFRGHQQAAYLTEHNEYRNLSTFLIGPARSGKTTLIGNMSYDGIQNDECVILFDFIENCEMSTQVAKLFPDHKVLNIVCDSEETAQGLGYNEIKYSDDPEEQYKNAKLQATQVTTLVNSINNGTDEPLTARMRRYLSSASLVSSLTNGSVNNVFSILQNHNVRHEFINRIPPQLSERMNEYVDYLYELDEYDKKGKEIIGTKISYVDGIISRLNILKDNPYMENMLTKSIDGNIDLVEEIEKPQLICIKMPEHMFNTDEERDVYCTYWMTKVWLALQVRAKNIPDKDKRRKVNLFVDEMYQVKNTEAFMSEKLNRFPKFRLKPIISCHYLNQLVHMKKQLAGANASYILIAGCDDDNYKELESQLKPYKASDVINLKEHHALCLVKNKGGYGKFITHLPAPVNKSVKQMNKEKENGVQLESNVVHLIREGDVAPQT